MKTTTIFENEKTVIYAGKVIGQRPKSYHIDFEGDFVWVPKSKVKILKDERVELPVWLAESKGLC